MVTELSKETDFTQQSWEFALGYTAAIGSLPSSVTSLVRQILMECPENTLVSCQTTTKGPQGEKTVSHENSAILTASARFFLSRFLRSRSVQAPYYYALLFLRPNIVNPAPNEVIQEGFFIDDFVNAFKPEEHAVLLPFLFMQRQTIKLINEDIAEVLTRKIQRGLNIGALVGQHIPSIGLARGLIVGFFRYLGMLPLAHHDPSGFRGYLKHLRRNELIADPNLELDRWETTSTQIALLLLQQMGFGMDFLTATMRALTTNSPRLSQQPLEQVLRAAAVWTDTLLLKEQAPRIPLPPQYYLTPAELERIRAVTPEKGAEPVATWLGRTSSDVTPTLTPRLFVGDIQSDEGEYAEVADADYSE
jgi:hypothetical protein